MNNKTGGYQLTFDGDLCRMVFSGHIQEQHAIELMTRQKEHSKGRPYLLTICDLRNFESVSPEARKAFAELSKDLSGRGTALYGASFQARVVATLVMRAASLFSGQDSPIYFCATEAEAWAWIAQRRRSLQEELKGAKNV